MYNYGLRSGSSSFYMADPINGQYITPHLPDGDDFCLHCAQEIRLAPLKPQDAYWFHRHTGQKNCLERELVAELQHNDIEGE